jgi:hypothetical protein
MEAVHYFREKSVFCGAVEMQKTAVISEMAANIKKLQKLRQNVIEISILEIFFFCFKNFIHYTFPCPCSKLECLLLLHIPC